MGFPSFPITEQQIDDLVSEFYRRVRQDETLGPIFLHAVGPAGDAWPPHEAHIAAFWRNAVGLDRSFSGNPMMKHLANPDIQPHHFPIWLALFRDTATDILPPATATGIAALADRIGRSLSFGLAQFRKPKHAVPTLTSSG